MYYTKSLATSNAKSLDSSIKLPFSSLNILSQIAKAPGLWVIIIQVGLCSKFLIDFKTLISVFASRAEVASSSIRIGRVLKKDLAIDILWAWPSDKPKPFSPKTVSNLSSSSFIKSKAQALIQAFLISS